MMYSSSSSSILSFGVFKKIRPVMMIVAMIPENVSPIQIVVKMEDAL